MIRFSIGMFLIASLIVLMVSVPMGQAEEASKGETLFKQHCAMCHPNGGNIVNPKKTLHQKELAANQVKTADDIVRLMRNPNPGMTKFDTTKISDFDAKEIAEYILRTFK